VTVAGGVPWTGRVGSFAYRFRPALSVAGVLLVVVVLVPPFAGAARRDEWAEAVQFMMFAVVAPGLFTLGAPWSLLGLGRSATALAEARRRHTERLRSGAIAAVAIVAAIAWRTPAAVNLLARHGPVAIGEAVTLTVSCTALWLEWVSSPPLVPRSPRPIRIALTVAFTWTIWVLAYIVGMSQSNWYQAYRHAAGHGLSLNADQQITAGVMWGVASCCFLPLIMWNLVQWLRNDEQPDEDMIRLLREERRRATRS
jgi:cytochrome c oxidase assembly factor CtaG